MWGQMRHPQNHRKAENRECSQRLQSAFGNGLPARSRKSQTRPESLGLSAKPRARHKAPSRRNRLR